MSLGLEQFIKTKQKRNGGNSATLRNRSPSKNSMNLLELLTNATGLMSKAEIMQKLEMTDDSFKASMRCIRKSGNPIKCERIEGFIYGYKLEKATQ